MAALPLAMKASGILLAPALVAPDACLEGGCCGMVGLGAWDPFAAAGLLAFAGEAAFARTAAGGTALGSVESGKWVLTGGGAADVGAV